MTDIRICWETFLSVKCKIFGINYKTRAFWHQEDASSEELKQYWECPRSVLSSNSKSKKVLEKCVWHKCIALGLTFGTRESGNGQIYSRSRSSVDFPVSQRGLWRPGGGRAKGRRRQDLWRHWLQAVVVVGGIGVEIVMVDKGVLVPDGGGLVLERDLRDRRVPRRQESVVVLL